MSMAQSQSQKLSLDIGATKFGGSAAANGSTNGADKRSLEQFPVHESAIVEDEDSGKDDDGLMIRDIYDHDAEVSQLKQHLRQRGKSIRFNSQAKLDDGHMVSLHAPLPGKEALDEDVSGHGHTHAIPIRQRPRRHSEADQEEFDALTGIPLNKPRQRKAVYHHGELRHPLLQTTVDELADDRRYGARIGELPSLTSERTASPIMDEVLTPQNDTMLSPLTSSPNDSMSPTEPKSLPTRRSVSQRSFGSLGSAGRRHTIKSNNSSLSSPARSFLSQWTRHDDVVKEPDPDDEGQEIGDNSGYIIGRKIGYGGFSVIKEVTTFENGQRVVRAVKIVRKQIKNKSENENDELQAQFDREVGVWRYLKHPYILPLIAVYESAFATFCITQLNIGGTVFDLIRSRRRSEPEGRRGLSASVAKKYIYQLASAIRYLHEDVRAVHRDIKPENCLLDMSANNSEIEGGTLLLCDFGMADFIHNEHRPQHEPENGSNGNGNVANIGPAMTSTNIQGSLEYIAPELFSADRPMYSTAADMWAFGCVVYTILTASMPFSHEFQPRLVVMIERGSYDIEALQKCLAVQEINSDAAIDLVQRCLTVSPEHRYSISDVLEHEFLAGCKELYEPAEFV